MTPTDPLEGRAAHRAHSVPGCRYCEAFRADPIPAATPRPAGVDVERLAEALDAPGVFEDPLDDALGLARDIAREYAALTVSEEPARE